MSSITFRKSKQIKLPYLDSAAFETVHGKGWGFSYVYHFIELRDVYLALREFGFSSLKEFTLKCITNKITSVKTKWNERRILEQLNALKNFKLISTDYKIINSNTFSSSSIGSTLSLNDMSVFDSIYFSYYRFCEIHSWFLDPITIERQKLISSINLKKMIDESKPIYSFSRNSRFFDSFIYELKDNTDLFHIEKSPTVNDEDLMRFWDVYVKWGIELGYIQKFNVQMAGYTFQEASNMICNYFIDKSVSEIDISDFIFKNFKRKHIYIPELILKLAISYRASIQWLKEYLIKEYEKNKSKFSLERTSEIFIRRKKIKDDDVILHPIYKSSYISHITVL